MSQYPQPPYQPVPYYGQPPAGNPLAPARRAGILMLVFGALGLLCGVFMVLGGTVLTPAQVAASPQAAQIQQAEAQFGMSIQQLMQIMAAVVGIPGLLFLALGFFVLRGGKVAIILSLILSGITILLLTINMLGGVAAGGANAAASLCMLGVPLVLGVLLIVWLIQALRAAPAVAAMGQQYQAQYAQHQQQYQAYQQQPGYGYGLQQQPPYGQQPGYGQQQQPPYGQGPVYPQQPGGPPPGSPPDAGSVRHPPLPPGPQDPNGPPQG